MDKPQKIGVSAFIFKDNKVLLLKRAKNKKAFPEYWELPGGKVEFGESAEDALAREVGEETGLKIKVGFPYSTFSYLFDNVHFTDIQFFCRITGDDEIKISAEHEEYAWVGESELDNLKISGQMAQAIEKGFQMIKIFFITYK